MDVAALPGGDWIREGIRDLTRGVVSTPALLVSIGAARLQRAGIDLPARPLADPERRLWEALAAEGADAAHGRYNALVRLLVSFERAAECGAR